MNLVRIVHPEAGEAEVPESAVPHWRSSGWELAPEREETPPAARETAQQDSKPSRSRRRSTDEESE